VGTSLRSRLDLIGSTHRLLFAEHVEARVGRDPIHPGAEARVWLVRQEMPPCFDARLLERVFGVLKCAEHPVRVGAKLAPATRPAFRYRSRARSELATVLDGRRDFFVGPPTPTPTSADVAKVTRAAALEQGSDVTSA
jgi:hypothetical protein